MSAKRREVGGINLYGEGRGEESYRTAKDNLSSTRFKMAELRSITFQFQFQPSYFTLRVEKPFLHTEVKQRVPFSAVQPLGSKLQGATNATTAAAAAADTTVLALAVVPRSGLFVGEDATAQAVGCLDIVQERHINRTKKE